MNEKVIKEKLVEYFLRYVAIPSQSNDRNLQVPSSDGQLALGKALAADLKKLDLEDISINQYGVVQQDFLKEEIKQKNLVGLPILILWMSVFQMKSTHKLLKLMMARI